MAQRLGTTGVTEFALIIIYDLRNTNYISLISIIGVVDTVGLKLVLDGKVENLLSSAVALSVKPADGSNFQETVFSISDPKTVQV